MSDDAAFLREQARRCRRLARGIATPDVVETLTQMATDYDARADEMENRSVLPGRGAGGEGDRPKGGGGVIGDDPAD